MQLLHAAYRMDFLPPLFLHLSEAFYIVNLSLAHPLSPSGSLFLFSNSAATPRGIVAPVSSVI